MKLCLAGVIALGIAVGAVAARAQDLYPARPIKIMCGFPAGSLLDVITRIYAGRLEKALGQAVVVENRVGVAGNIASEAVAHSAPDGYTLLANGVNLPISIKLFKKLPFDVMNDLAPIGFMGNIPIILSASESPASHPSQHPLRSRKRARESSRMARLGSAASSISLASCSTGWPRSSLLIFRIAGPTR